MCSLMWITRVLLCMVYMKHGVLLQVRMCLETDFIMLQMFVVLILNGILRLSVINREDIIRNVCIRMAHLLVVMDYCLI